MCRAPGQRTHGAMSQLFASLRPNSLSPGQFPKAQSRMEAYRLRVSAQRLKPLAPDEPSWAAGTRPARGDENVTSEVAENRASANCFQNNTDKKSTVLSAFICVNLRP